MFFKDLLDLNEVVMANLLLFVILGVVTQKITAYCTMLPNIGVHAFKTI